MRTYRLIMAVAILILILFFPLFSSHHRTPFGFSDKVDIISIHACNCTLEVVPSPTTFKHTASDNTVMHVHRFLKTTHIYVSGQENTDDCPTARICIPYDEYARININLNSTNVTQLIIPAKAANIHCKNNSTLNAKLTGLEQAINVHLSSGSHLNIESENRLNNTLIDCLICDDKSTLDTKGRYPLFQGKGTSRYLKGSPYTVVNVKLDSASTFSFSPTK